MRYIVVFIRSANYVPTHIAYIHCRIVRFSIIIPRIGIILIGGVQGTLNNLLAAYPTGKSSKLTVFARVLFVYYTFCFIVITHIIFCFPFELCACIRLAEERKRFTCLNMLNNITRSYNE